MWASAKIDQLLDDIAVYGQQSELVNAVKRLGIKYNIVTPYTSMLVVEPGTPIVEDKTVKLSNHTLELRNTPNPFVSSTVIKFSLPASIGTGRVTLKILDCRGRLVRILVNDTFTKGNYMVGWDGTDRFGRMVNPGLFLAVLDVNGNQKMITMRLVK